MPTPPRTMSPQPLTWTPPADPDKPACPYRAGFTVNINTHVPPAPFGCRSYGPGTRTTVAGQPLRSLKQTELVLANPPLGTLDSPNPPSYTLSVTDVLAAGDGRGAQVVVCTVTPKVSASSASNPAPSPSPFQAVAKIYDPLYYSFRNRDVPSVPCDVTLLADQDYSCEAAAYEHLKAIGQAGAFAPRYYGSFTFTARVMVNKTTPRLRQVRLILIEHIQGPSIRDLCRAPRPAAPAPAAAFSEACRLEVLARVMEGDAKLRWLGIMQRDVAGRNVLLQWPPGLQTAAQRTTLPRVVLIDYNVSVVYARTIRKIGPYDGMKLPPNPMELYWTNALQEFWGWIPVEWETNPKLRQQWLSKRFGGNNMASFAPLTEKLEFAK
ncbi:hypothetical protein N658DRAFT_480024 [Parathielavia hyrcaniae]|uniref:Protein kinase domain-containing protein n=1 Tax=Parathielavia hyrcaniae TaxID=113614 RepID=A0AAN6SWU9_9PEZI|nr:hypothetical protein N658DRAFT_480024 [Parathielavia hyrcaniae]